PPSNFVWQWPGSFVPNGLQRMVALGRLTPERGEAILATFSVRVSAPHTLMITPAMLEIIAVRRRRCRVGSRALRGLVSPIREPRDCCVWPRVRPTIERLPATPHSKRQTTMAGLTRRLFLKTLAPAVPVAALPASVWAPASAREALAQEPLEAEL